MVANNELPDKAFRHAGSRCSVALLGLSLTVLLASGPALADDLPQRKSGLWAFTSQDNAFADWKMCVDDTSYNLVESDIWSDFRDECEVQSFDRDGASYKLAAKCLSGFTGAADLFVALDGDFSTRYRLSIRTESAGLSGEMVVQSSTLDAEFVGACPEGLVPGAKEMRGGMVVQPPEKTAPASDWAKP
ncbi:hypothetical protein BLJAPNOD_01496 [Ensifer sp. M14]|nr:hypothetical protein BLJAPNOD_01496 [Ensifer sp. M14]